MVDSLLQAEREALADFCASVRAQFGSRLRQLAMFGLRERPGRGAALTHENRRRNAEDAVSRADQEDAAQELADAECFVRDARDLLAREGWIVGSG